MKILLSAYACEPNKGSEPGVGWNWALALVRRGHQVWVITRSNNQQVIELALNGLGEPYISNLHFIYYDTPNWILRFKKSALGVHLYYGLWQRGILGVAKKNHQQHQFDVVQHLTFGAWRQPTQLYKLNIPCMFGPVGGGETSPWALVHGMPGLKSKFSEYLRYLVNWLSLFNPSLQKCLKQCFLIISKTQETAAWIKKMGVNSVVSLEIGIEPKPIKNKETPTIGQLRCLYAGRLISWKGVHLAIQAIALARQKGANVTLTIIGDGPLLGNFKRLVSELGLAESVVFMGQLKQIELFAKYERHDVLLFPSLHDSSGNVVLEALALGLPVVCLNLGGPSVLVDQTCGQVIDVNEVDQTTVIERLSASLVNCANVASLLLSLREGAQAKVLSYTWDNAVNRVYEKVEVEFQKVEG